MYFHKGNVESLGRIALFVLIIATVLIGVLGTSKATSSYSCSGAVDTLIHDMEYMIDNFKSSIRLGRGKLEPDPVKIPSCVVCVYENNNDLIFKLENGEEKKIDATNHNIINNEGDKTSCEDSGINGGKRFTIEFQKDSIDMSTEIDIIFTKRDSE